MSKLVRLMLVVLLLALFSIGTSFAQGVDDQGNPNDPTVNDRANACYEGGELEGKCDTPEEWAGGWFLIRYRAGLLGSVPDSSEWVLKADASSCTIALIGVVPGLPASLDVPLDVLLGMTTRNGAFFWLSAGPETVLFWEDVKIVTPYGLPLWASFAGSSTALLPWIDFANWNCPTPVPPY
jgi:hypothetical protein